MIWPGKDRFRSRRFWSLAQDSFSLLPNWRQKPPRRAVGLRADGNETGRMFDGIKDDRHVLLTAMAGKADILVTGNMREFRACRHVPRAGPKSPGALLHRPKTGQGAHATSRRQCPAFRAGACRRTG